MGKQPDRAAVFIDGNNWYHSLRENNIPTSLSYRAVSQKISGPGREWVLTRYYIGALKSDHRDFSDQRRFLSRLEAEDSRISVRRGRIETQHRHNPLDTPLRNLVNRTARLPAGFKSELISLLDAHRNLSSMKEKAADVFLAVDMCRLALEDRYDAAYLLSADGDFTPAVETVQAAGKKVYVASPGRCYALGQATTYISLKPEWFDSVRL